LELQLGEGFSCRLLAEIELERAASRLGPRGGKGWPGVRHRSRPGSAQRVQMSCTRSLSPPLHKLAQPPRRLPIDAREPGGRTRATPCSRLACPRRVATSSPLSREAPSER